MALLLGAWSLRGAAHRGRARDLLRASLTETCAATTLLEPFLAVASGTRGLDQNAALREDVWRPGARVEAAEAEAAKLRDRLGLRLQEAAKLKAENVELHREVSKLRGGAETPPPDENDTDEPPLLLSNNAAQPDRDAQPESSIDVALGDTFTSSGSLRS